MFVSSVQVDAVYKNKHMEVSVQNDSENSQADGSGLQVDVDGVEIGYPSRAYFLGF